MSGNKKDSRNRGFEEKAHLNIDHDKYVKNYHEIFGLPKSQFCDTCEKRFSYCECSKEETYTVPENKKAEITLEKYEKEIVPKDVSKRRYFKNHGELFLALLDQKKISMNSWVEADKFLYINDLNILVDEDNEYYSSANFNIPPQWFTWDEE